MTKDGGKQGATRLAESKWTVPGGSDKVHKNMIEWKNCGILP